MLTKGLEHTPFCFPITPIIIATTIYWAYTVYAPHMLYLTYSSITLWNQY